MKDKLSAFWSGFKDKWSSLAKNLRIFIITAVSVVIVAAILLAIVLNQKGYTAIYTGLDSEESSQVVSAINELGITDVKMGTDGSISVPSDQADNVRMQLSIQGYPKSTFNFDVWNSGIGIWSTDTEKKVLQIQQLQTHLMKAINTISAVKNSYVIITMPENSNYVISTDSEEPRVSVKLDLKNGAQLTSDQVEGIYALVLNSLPGLERENISILDSDGKLLSGENTTVEEDVLYQSRLNFQEQMQSLLKSQLNDTLKKLYKDYTINVNVKLNYDNSKSEYTIYTPSVAEDGTSGGMIESSTKNEGWGGIGSLSGVVGTTSNSDISPNYPTITGDGDNQYYYQNSITVKRLVNTEIRQLEKNGYSVDKITAAVTVDQINMLEADKEQLREVIAFAIGADVANVTVANYPFVINGNNGTNGNGNTINRGGSVDWTVYIILLLGLLVLALLIVAILTSNAKKKKRAKARAKAAAAQAAAAQAAQESAALSFEPQPQPDEEFNIQHLDDYDDESKSAVLKKEIKDFSRTNPDVVAQLIRSMMKNGE
jgi:flagellar M-ring protein FliF